MQAMANSSEHRIAKRSSNACSRCRRHKIKCSGLQPCANCNKRSISCIFDDRDNKVLVTQGYLSDLQQKVSRLEREHSTAAGPSEANNVHPSIAEHVERNVQLEERLQQASRSSAPGTRESSPKRDQVHLETTELTNPLIESPSKFMSSSSGRTFYLGTSSNWSFHGQILNLVHQHIHRTPLPGADLLFDGSAYHLPWDGSRSLPDSNTPIIPSIDHAIYLINAVKFHCAQLVHLFDEDEFMTSLQAFYSNTENGTRKDSLWYIQFLLIIAFGKTFEQRGHQDPRPPGAEFFFHALQLLPDTNRLCREPIQASEILCCIALYLQALDSRNAAHVTIGQAMRIALAQGMHTDMPIELGEPLVQRCRKIWWTIYILDRQMSALMGLPQAIHDEDISCQLPSFPNSAQRTAALKMQIKLARIYADIAKTVYGSKGRLRKKFVISIKAVLDDMAVVAEELRHSFPLHANERIEGISRMPAHLHLLYYQTIIITTRPLLFCCLKKAFESPREVRPLVSSRKIRPLLTMSLDASLKILNIIEKLHGQNLLETFLPWDLDALFVSTMVLILTQFVDTSLVDSRFAWLDKAFSFLDTMIASGNRIAKFRVIELRKLEDMLSEYSATREHERRASNTAEPASENAQRTSLAFPAGVHCASSLLRSEDTMAMYTGLSDESSGFGDDLTAEQILAVAESMDLGGTDWLESFATMDNFQMVDDNSM